MKRLKWSKFLLAVMITAVSMMALPGRMDKVQAVSENQTMQLNDTFFGGTIEQGGEVDFYNFTIAAPGWVTITYQGWNISYSNYAIYNDDQTEVYDSYNVYGSSDTNPKTSSVTLALEAGTYIVKVWGLENFTGDYKLKGSYQAAGNNETEPNNYFQSAMPLEKNNLVTGFFSETDSVDFYSFTLTAPATVNVMLTSRMGRIYFSVWNKDFLQVEAKTVYSASESSPITATMQLKLDAGTYYIRCNPSNFKFDNYSCRCGRYQIKWAFAPTLVKSVSIGGNKTIAAGSRLQLSASVMPQNADNRTLVWTSSNTSVATVNANTGKVSAKTAGSTIITAAAADGSNVKASITVIVKPKQMAKPKGKALGKKRVRISWSRQKGITYYQVQYAKNKRFKKAKTLSYASNIKKKTITLKKKGTYYFRVRSASRVNGAVLKGKWSKSIKVRVR